MSCLGNSVIAKELPDNLCTHATQRLQQPSYPQLFISRHARARRIPSEQVLAGYTVECTAAANCMAIEIVRASPRSASSRELST
jgi:hypothetical protein